VVALSQRTPWLLVVRADLAADRGDIGAVKPAAKPSARMSGP
jgi:hypothetical protein